eukprot:4373177-Pyramimonas_sp.AAC.1
MRRRIRGRTKRNRAIHARTRDLPRPSQPRAPSPRVPRASSQQTRPSRATSLSFSCELGAAGGE